MHYNLVGVSTGYKRTQGKLTEISAIILYVRQKGILRRGCDIFPDEIRGYPVDAKDVELGSSIGIAESRETSGTLSAVVHDKNSKQMGILSCEHVCRFSESSTGMGVIIHQLSHKDLDNLIQSIIDMATRIYMYTPEWYNARNNTEKSINSLEKFYELIWPDFETYDTYDIDQNASIDLSEYCDSSYSETETETESISSDSSYFSESDYIS
ncbi:unnamed protein product [Rhizophagus irregularis]|nr:unnamed protein product [Rhizophagus irregularis]